VVEGRPLGKLTLDMLVHEILNIMSTLSSSIHLLKESSLVWGRITLAGVMIYDTECSSAGSSDGACYATMSPPLPLWICG
jgi:hypothetical protein